MSENIIEVKCPKCGSKKIENNTHWFPNRDKCTIVYCGSCSCIYHVYITAIEIIEDRKNQKDIN